MPATRSLGSRMALVGTSSLLFLGLIVPAVLGGIGSCLARRQAESAQQCGASLNAGQWAWRLLQFQRSFPGWRDAARRRQSDLLRGIVGGVTACRHDVVPPPGLIDATARFLVGRLPRVALDPHDGVRRTVERFLHEHGRDREIVELRPHLPRGGDVRERVRAYLTLGDLAGAAEVWREPEAEIGMLPMNLMLLEGNVLCLAGQYDAGLTAFARDHLLYHQIGTDDFGHDSFVVHHAECAARAGRHDLAMELARETVAPPMLAPLLAGEAALARGDVAGGLDLLAPFADRMATLTLEEDEFLVDLQLLQLEVFVRAGRPAEAAALGNEGQLGYYLHGLSHDRFTSEIFNPIHFPALDERRLRGVADALAARPDAEARRVASAMYTVLALLVGRRWDDGAEDALRLAESADPTATAPTRLREALARYHGQAEVIVDPERAVGGDDPRDSSSWLDVEHGILNPSMDEELTAVVRLISSGLDRRQKLEILRTQAGEAALPNIFYRLTLLVVHGEKLGADIGRWRRELAALRDLVAAQPNQRLLDDRDNIERF